MKTNVCKYLRSKKMYVPAQADELSNAPEADNYGPCWCNRTMAEVGPDDRQVGAQNCSTPSRSCYEE